MAAPETVTVDPHLQIVDLLCDEIRKFGNHLWNQETQKCELQMTLVRLMNALITEYQKLRAGFTKNTGMLAWACRNILELNIFIQYVLLSKSNLQRFLSDRLIDGIDIFESFKAWQQSYEPGAQTSGIDETLRWARAQQNTEGLVETKPLRMSPLSEEVGLQLEYRHLNKVCSKLIHPTAWSLLTMNDEGEYAAFRPILLYSAVRHGSQALEKIKDHFEKFGVEPAL